MLSKKQVFEAALKYAQDQNHGKNKAAIEPDCDFIAGAMWAADELASILEAKQVVISGYQKMLSAKMAELSRLETEIHLRQETISGYQQVLAARTEALEAIIDRYEVANMLAGDDPVIEKAKKVLEKL